MLIAIQCYAAYFWNSPGSLFFSAHSAEVRFSSVLHHVYDCFSSPIQKFYGYVEQTESWLSSKEAFLANEDLGVGALRNYNFLCNWSGGKGAVKYDDVL